MRKLLLALTALATWPAHANGLDARFRSLPDEILVCEDPRSHQLTNIELRPTEGTVKVNGNPSIITDGFAGAINGVNEFGRYTGLVPVLSYANWNHGKLVRFYDGGFNNYRTYFFNSPCIPASEEDE